MSRIIIFSHDSDIDGLGCVVLCKLAFFDVDYVLCPNVEKLEAVFRKHLQSNMLEIYDNIFITDLALYNPSLSMVSKSYLQNKIYIFDHHQKAIDDGVNIFPFTKIIEKDNEGKKCATQLFYQFLVQHNFLKRTAALDEFVELTRLEDTWDWKN